MQAQPQGVCAAPPLTRNPFRVWKGHAMETMEAAAAMIGRVEVACVGGSRHGSGGDGGGHRRRQRRRSEWIGGVFMAVLRLPVVGLTTLLSMVVMGALVVAFEAFEVLDGSMEACLVVVHGEPCFHVV